MTADHKRNFFIAGLPPLCPPHPPCIHPPSLQSFDDEDLELIHTDQVSGLVASHDGTCCISASFDMSLIVWDLAEGVKRWVLEGHTKSVYCVAISHDDKTAASGSEDSSVRLWCLRTGTCLRVIQGAVSNGIVFCLAFSPDDTSLTVGGDHGQLKQWSVIEGAPTQTFTDGDSWERMNSRVSCVVYKSPSMLVSGSAKLNVWDVDRGTHEYSISDNEQDFGDVTGLSVSADGSVLVSICECGIIVRQDDSYVKGFPVRHDDIRIRRFTQRGDGRISVSPGHDLAVSSFGGNAMVVWDPKTGTNLAQMVPKSSWYAFGITAITVSPDCITIICGYFYGRVTVWRFVK